MTKRKFDFSNLEIVDDAVAEILRGKSIAERLQMCAAANAGMRILIAMAVQTEHPEWDEKKIAREVANRVSGGLSERARALMHLPWNERPPL